MLAIIATLLLLPAVWIAVRGIGEGKPRWPVVLSRVALVVIAVGFIVDLWIG